MTTYTCPYCHVPVQESYKSKHDLRCEGRIVQKADDAIASATKDVSRIYAAHPEARGDNGILLTEFAKSYPMVRYYETATRYGISADIVAFIYFAKNANSILRLGRDARRAKITGEAIEPISIEGKRTKTEEAVRLIQLSYPSTRSNEGEIYERILRYYGLEGISCTYDHETHRITLEADTKERLGDALRYVEGISRASRRQRIKYPNESHARARAVQYAYSTTAWAGRNGEIGNIYHG